MAKKAGKGPSESAIISRPANETRNILQTHLGYTSKKEGAYTLFKGTKYGMWKAGISRHEKGTRLNLTHLDNPEMPNAYHFTSPPSFIEDELEDIKKTMWRAPRRGKSFTVGRIAPKEKKPAVDVDAAISAISFYLGEVNMKTTTESFVDREILRLNPEVKAVLEKIDDPKLIEKCEHIKSRKGPGYMDDMYVRSIIRHLAKELTSQK